MKFQVVSKLNIGLLADAEIDFIDLAGGSPCRLFCRIGGFRGQPFLARHLAAILSAFRRRLS
jgi:hypothetical protein